MKTRAMLLGASLSAALFAHGALAGVALFANATDTIRASSDTTLAGASTYEARILFTAAYSRTGLVFNEWTDSAEDKTLSSGPGTPGSLLGFNWPVNTPPGALTATPPIGLNEWHHVAMVYDGAEERLYLDGTRVAFRAATGAIGNSVGLPHIGSIYRDSGVQTAFGGYVDWLRVSSTARYSGASFAPPADQPASDADTQLLYYFDEAPGSTIATDQSAFHRDGTLGTDAIFAGATSPVFAADPLAPARLIPTLDRSSLILLALLLAAMGAAVLAVRRP